MPDWLSLRPRHGFFVKDGRGWHSGSAGRGRSLDWPLPQTVRGALTTAIGRELESARRRLNTRDEWLALKHGVRLRGLLALRASADVATWSAEHRMWPAPADALHFRPEGLARRLRWERQRASVGVLDSREDPKVASVAFGFVDTHDKPASGPRWWTDDEFVRWLTGEDTAAPPCDTRGRAPRLRVDVHVKIDPEARAAEPHMLWSNDFHETLIDSGVSGAPEVHAWAMGVGLELDVDGVEAPPWATRTATATFGGDSRLADLDAAAEIAACPDALLARVREGGVTTLRLYVITPTVFDQGWCPDGFELSDGVLVGPGPGGVGDLVLTGAMVGRRVPISGWDMASGGGAARDLSWAVPPGSVYAVRRASGAPFLAADVEALWLARWGARADDGFGYVVAGVEPADVKEGESS